MVGMSDVPGGVVNANHLLLFRVGVGLLTAGGGPSGGASDVAVARCLTLEQWPVVSWPRFSRGVWLIGQLLLRRTGGTADCHVRLAEVPRLRAKLSRTLS